MILNQRTVQGGSGTNIFPHTLFSRLIVITAIFSSVFGCIQETPPSSAERTEELLVRLLHDENFETRRTAAESLGKIGHEAAAGLILPLLEDDVPLVRASAAWALGQFASSSSNEVISALSRTLADPEEFVRRLAAVAIGNIEPGTGDLKPVVNLLHNPDVQLRRAAVYALLQVDVAPWQHKLIPALNDPDVEVRQGITAILGASGGRETVNLIRNRLSNDPSPAVRIEAIYQIGRSDDPAIRQDLERILLNDPDNDVKRWAAMELRS